MTSINIYRVRFIQSQRYAINIGAPSAELAEFFAEEIRKKAGAAPFEAIREPFSGDWQSEQTAPQIPPTSSPLSPMPSTSSGAAVLAGTLRKIWPTLSPGPRRKAMCRDPYVAVRMAARRNPRLAWCRTRSIISVA
jgi:hypothetical protein